MNFKKKLLSVLVGAALTSVSFGAAFQTYEQSATTMGAANAGITVTTDPSVQYYNPAGMAFIKDTEVAISGIIIRTNAQLTPVKATGLNASPFMPGPGRNIIPSSSTAGPGFQATSPGFYVVRPVNPNLRFGIGMEAPFGLETLYPNNSVARYFALESKLETINLNPSFSYLVDSHFSIGGGLIMQYAEANLSQAVDAGGFISSLTGLPVSPGQDLVVDNRATGLALGWDAGLEVKPNPNNAIGLSYHSAITQHMTGSATVTGKTVPFQFLNSFTTLRDSAASTTLNLPGYFMLGGSHKLTSKWTVMAEADYILWDRLQKLTINYAFSGMAPSTLAFDYHNTWRLALGQSYQAAKDLTLRMGVAWDESPIPNNLVRSARLPSDNRFWVSVGGTYDIDTHASVSFGYSHIFIKSAQVNSTAPNGLTYVANYRGSADLVGAQLNLKFS